MAFASSITIFFPFVFEFIFTLCNSKQLDVRSFVFNHRNRDVLLLFFIPDLYMLWIGLPNATTHYSFMYALFLSRDSLLNAHFMKEIISVGDPIWNNWSYILIVLPLVVCNLIYSIQYAEKMISDDASTTITVIIESVVAFIFLLIIINSIRWYRTVRTVKNWSKNERCCAVYLIMYFLYISASWGSSFQPSNTPSVWYSLMGEGLLSYYTCTVTLSFLVNYFINSHLNKLYEAQVIKAML